MQFKVPQNISMEDKIAGPLTMVQFIIMIVGGGIAFVVLNITLISPVNQFLAIIVALLTIVLAIGRFNDQPMYKFFKYIILFVTTPRTRVWHKEGHTVQLVKPSIHIVNQKEHHTAKSVTKDDIARLAKVLDSRGSATTPLSSKPPKPS